jgi:hypothetical protein
MRQTAPWNMSPVASLLYVSAAADIVLLSISDNNAENANNHSNVNILSNTDVKIGWMKEYGNCEKIVHV